jgi:hypothetical protein
MNGWGLRRPFNDPGPPPSIDDRLYPISLGILCQLLKNSERQLKYSRAWARDPHARAHPDRTADLPRTGPSTTTHSMHSSRLAGPDSLAHSVTAPDRSWTARPPAPQADGADRRTHPPPGPVSLLRDCDGSPPSGRAAAHRSGSTGACSSRPTLCLWPPVPRDLPGERPFRWSNEVLEPAPLGPTTAADSPASTLRRASFPSG